MTESKFYFYLLLIRVQPLKFTILLHHQLDIQILYHSNMEYARKSKLKIQPHLNYDLCPQVVLIVL